MNKIVAAACAIGAGGLAAWYMLSLRADRRVATAAARIAPAPVDQRSAALAAEITRLRRHEDAVAQPRHGRDVFRFGAPPVKAASVAAVAAIQPALPPAPVVAPRPALTLIGVAEDRTTGATVRTAIISAPGQLYLVKEGERVASRYGVARILPDVVELVDTGDATAVRLALK
jgi:hypothetical protein